MTSKLLLSTAILLACCLRSIAQDPDLIPYLSDSAKNGLNNYLMDSVPYTEPVPPKKEHYFYYTLRPGTGVSTLLTPHNDGILNISFPYRLNGSPETFNSGDQQPYISSRIFVLPLGMEVGTWNQFIDFNLDWSFKGGSYQGVDLSVGYGHNFYLGGHSDDIAKDRLVIKPSINFVWREDGGGSASAKLGSIDNTGNTIEALGYTAGPTYDVTTSDYDGNGDYIGSSTSTNNASTLDIVYTQTQYAIRPEIALSNNQYRKTLHWELSAGYDITLSERGGIALTQDGSNPVAHLIELDRPGLTATYNGQSLHSTPYHFSGFYLRFALDFVLHKGNTP
jgi:hypothetical protein